MKIKSLAAMPIHTYGRDKVHIQMMIYPKTEGGNNLFELCVIIKFQLDKLPYSGFCLRGPNLCELCEMPRARTF